MKKSYLLKCAAIAICAVAAIPFAANAAIGDEFESNGLKFEDIGNNEAALVANDYSGSITVPATVVNGEATYNVTTIGDDEGTPVFINGVTAVELPEGLTTLKSHAFSTSTFKEVTLPSTLTTLQSNCFYLTNITSLDIPDGVTEIPDHCFTGNTQLTEISLGTNVTRIGAFAMDDSWSMTAIKMRAATPPTLGETIFGKNYNEEIANATTVTVPSGCKEAYETAWAAYNFKEFIEDGSEEPETPQIGTTFETDDGTGRMLKFQIIGETEVAMLGNNYSGAIMVPASVTYEDQTYAVTTIDGSSGGDVFGYNVTNVELPEGLTTLKSYTFSMAQITELELPSTLTTLEGIVFFQLMGLYSLEIPDGVTEIPAQCFFACTGLNELSLGSGITTINTSSLQGCASLTTLRMKPTTPPNISEDAFGTDGVASPSRISVYVPSGCKEAYETAWAAFGFKEFIEDSGVGINNIDNGGSQPITYAIVDGGIQLSSNTLNGAARIYTTSGKLMTSADCTNGYIPAQLPHGLYLLNIGNTTIKIIIK